MKLNKGLRFCHRWIGLFLSLTVISISLTGSLLVWKKEYLWLTLPDARDAVHRDIGSLANTIEKITSQYAENELLLLQLNSENLALHKAFLDEGKRAWHNQQGAVIDEWSENGRFEDWLLDLHHRFLLGNDIGLNIAGFSGLLLFPLIILGLIIWWPRRKQLRQGLLPPRVRRNKKAELIRSHSNIGFIIALPILLISITGVILTYPDQSREWLLEPFMTEDDYLLSDGPLDSITGVENATWFNVLERALDQHPDATIRWVSPPSYFSSYRVVGLQQKKGWNRSGKTTIYVDARTGYMDVNINDLWRPKIERLIDFSYPLHTAKLGLWYRLLLTLFGLSLFTISLFGLISFFKR